MSIHTIWETPNYRFVFKDGKVRSKKYKKIIIKVTDSIPNWSHTQGGVISVVDEILDSKFKHKIRKTAKIIDFGAGRLRNTYDLLTNYKKYTVYPIEFKEAREKSEFAKGLYDETTGIGSRCKPLQFPSKFFNEPIEAELVIAANVHNVMPVPAERLLSIQYLRDKIEDNKYFLYYGLHNHPNSLKPCTPENAIGDGHYKGVNVNYKTFYHNYKHPDEVDVMFYMNGFRKVWHKTISYNVVRMYKKVGKNPLTSNILNATRIREHVKGGYAVLDNEDFGKTQKGVLILNKPNKKYPLNEPDNDNLKYASLMIEALNDLPIGGQSNASSYQNLISAILLHLFSPELTNLIIEDKINPQKDSIDITLSNRASKGFFNRWDNNVVIVECKNVQYGVDNGIEQIISRFNNARGKRGIIFYRRDQDEKSRVAIIDRCKDHLKNNNHYILCLNDKHVEELLRHKLNNTSIDDFMYERYDELLDR